jgi:membrane fusion protein (multidrug efflux system)
MKLFSTFAFAGGALALLLVVGCNKPSASTPAAAGGPPPTQVVIAEVKVQPVTEKLSLVGTVAANEQVEIKAETDGTVLEVLFEEGKEVEKGALLLKLDERKLIASVNEAEANFKLSQANFDRARELQKDKLISQQEFDQALAMFQMTQAGLELKRQQLRDTKIYAPFDGIVSVRQVSPGQVIARNATLTYLIDLDPVKVEFNVPERFLSRVDVKQDIEITVAAYPGRKFRGKVFFVSPYIDPGTRTALVKAEIANLKHELKPGMFANLDLSLMLREQALVIPESAIVPSGERVSVFVIDDQQTAQVRPVKLGVRLEGAVEVLEGLKAGEKVIAEGVQKVRPGGKVTPRSEGAK